MQWGLNVLVEVAKNRRVLLASAGLYPTESAVLVTVKLRDAIGTPM